MTVNPTTLATSPVTEAQALLRDLRGAFVERDQESRSLLIALLAEEHVLLLGPPGTGKSALTQALCGALAGSSFFQVLMTRYTVPEEVFGPVSLAGLERDEYRRVTSGYLPSSEVSFLDEVFKANSSILNALLTALNEGAFDNGGQRSPIPLKLCVGASNELPTDDSLHALYDRFVLRHWVEPIRDRGALRRLLTSSSEPKVSAQLSPASLAALRAQTRAVVVPDAVADILLDLRDALAKEGITASDRRWRKCVKLVRASAALEGRTTAESRDLLALTHALWREPGERPVVGQIVARHAAPKLGEAVKLHDAALEIHGKVQPEIAGMSTGTITPAQIASVGNANREIVKIRKQLESLVAEEPTAAEYAEKVGTMQNSIARAMMKAQGL